MKRKQLTQVVLVTGGRDYQRKDTVFGVLDEHHKNFPIRLLVQGGAKGADTFAIEWAKARGIPYETVRPDYKKHGRPAAYVRNQIMIDQFRPRLVVSFPGNNGTADCTRKAYNAGCRVDLVNGEEHGKW